MQQSVENKNTNLETLEIKKRVSIQKIRYNQRTDEF